MKHSIHPGVLVALAAAALFGAGAPLAKPLLTYTGPWLLAGLLYLGSGIGLWLARLVRRPPAARLSGADRGWLAGAIVCGGVIGPVLLLTGLAAMPASGVSLLLNAEGVLTALLAWFVFGENVGHRVALGMAAIVAGVAVLGWPSEAHFAGVWPTLAVLGACLAWALDNNLTRKVSLADAGFIAMTKGLVAGGVNLALALATGATWPEPAVVVAASLLGFASYGASLVLFVIGLRHLGTARTSAYFSVAPFFGATLAIVLLDEPISARLALASGLMALGVWLHITERHEHIHVHEAMEHEHVHLHDTHHQHPHDGPVAPGTCHSHLHQHAPLVHSHPHYPDAHHRHQH